jgi:hypothetical protein
MRVSSVLVHAIEAIRSHDIGGYEWECYSCHRHWLHQLGLECLSCHQLVTEEQIDCSFWEDGKPASSDDDLIARADVLALFR